MTDHATSTPTIDRPTTSTWARIATLPIEIESTSFRNDSLAGATSFTRTTTEVSLHGAGHTGRGEDISYDPASHETLPAHLASLQLTGSWTLESFSAHLDTLPITPDGGTWDDHPNYRRWAIESAALDLALRQAGLTFAAAVGREPRPLTYCLSMGLGSPPSAATVLAWLDARPGTRFKLDASREWSDELCDELAATGAVAVVDIKGMYTGPWIDNTPDPALYARLAQRMPGVVLEDPKLTDETLAALGDDGLARHAWDAALHSLEDLVTLTAEHRPVAANIKPSRFGTVREVLDVIAWCEEQDMPMYAGGQFELGYGRTQAQQLAATFYPIVDNDIAPVRFHTASPGDVVPGSPLDLPAGAGFGFDVGAGA